MNIPKDLTAASAVPLVLALLSRHGGYGYDLVRRLEALSNGHVKWRPGMIYPILHRLKRKKWVTSSRTRTRTGPDRIYYRLTSGGKRALHENLKPWLVIFLTLKRIDPKGLKRP